jgi:chemotaxis protein MotB
MARTRASRRIGGDYWPGFVDAMATLLLVMTFLLSVFMLAQYFVTQEASTKDTALARLNQQLAQLTELLALERSQRRSLEEELAALSATLSSTQSDRDRLQGLLSAAGQESDTVENRITALTGELEREQQVSAQALAQVELLNQQLAALRRQLAALSAALEQSEQRDQEAQTRIADLGRRLNAALARQVQELSRFRSEFFGRLRAVLGDRPDIQIVGDRFVFQAEVFFDSGSAVINPEGREELVKLAAILGQLENEIPSEVDWVLRIDGHTDIRPIATATFPSNWELSSARAISVVKFLISRGVPAGRLVAAGFGEFQPLDGGTSEDALRRNRRIELKLTEK